MDYWLYNNKKITKLEQLPQDAVGIVYLLENLNNGRKYIGKKILKFRKRTKTTKKDKLISRKKTKVIISESDWLKYSGSSVELNSDLEKGDKIKKSILKICFSKAEMSYWEGKTIFDREALLKEEYYNKWLSLRIHKRLL